MKKLGKSIAVAALAVAATNAAEAAIQNHDVTPDGSELVFNVVNYTAQNSYVLDLGVTIADFIANPDQTLSFNLNDSNFGDFATAFTAGDNVAWGVSGAYSTLNDLPDFDIFGFYTTSVSANPASIDENKSDIDNTIGKWEFQLVSPINTLNSVDVNDSSFNVAPDPGYTGVVGNDFQTALPFVGQGALGSSLFFAREKVSLENVGELDVYANVWNFAFSGSTGTLTFGPAISAVPLPAAVWMFGAGLMAMLRLNRRQSLAA